VAYVSDVGAAKVLFTPHPKVVNNMIDNINDDIIFLNFISNEFKK